MPAERITTATPWHVVLVLDDSTSMKANQGAENINRGLEALLDELEMKNMGTKERIWLSVVQFHSQPTLVVEHKSELQIRGTIPKFEANFGSTNMAAALDMALEVLNRNPGKTTDFNPYVLLLTDGAPDNPEAARSAALRLKAASPAAGQPYLVAVGVTQDADMDFLKSIASTPELAVFLPEPKDITKLLPTIGTIVGSAMGVDGVNRSIANVGTQILGSP
jgi:uncharacterized protein YegL